MAFEHLVSTYNIPLLHHFRYLQIWDFTRRNFSSFPSIPPLDGIGKCLDINPYLRGQTSRLYNIIQDMGKPPLDRLRGSWEEEFGGEISDESWHSAVTMIHSSSVCIRHGLIQFKIFHRLHLCRNRLAKLYPNVDPTCVRCHQASATLFHMFWSIPALTLLWTSIFKTFSHMCGKDINPIIGIFGTAPGRVTFPNSQSEAITFSSLLARRLILLRWKATTPPSHAHWVKSIMSHLKLEKLNFTIRGSSQKFVKIWQPFLDYFGKEFPSSNLG